jgi:hypothetical protein
MVYDGGYKQATVRGPFRAPNLEVRGVPNWGIGFGEQILRKIPPLALVRRSALK